MALNMPLFAQFGYWYHTDFIELSSKNDSIIPFPQYRLFVLEVQAVCTSSTKPL